MVMILTAVILSGGAAEGKLVNKNTDCSVVWTHFRETEVWRVEENKREQGEEERVEIRQIKQKR